MNVNTPKRRLEIVNEDPRLMSDEENLAKVRMIVAKCKPMIPVLAARATAGILLTTAAWMLHWWTPLAILITILTVGVCLHLLLKLFAYAGGIWMTHVLEWKTENQ